MAFQDIFKTLTLTTVSNFPSERVFVTVVLQVHSGKVTDKRRGVFCCNLRRGVVNARLQILFCCREEVVQGMALAQWDFLTKTFH